MSLVLKQSTAVDVLIGPFLDLTDMATAEEGESPAVLLSKNGQALGAKNDDTTPVHDDAGYYNCELDATDTDTVGTLVLAVEKSANALPVRHEFQVIEEAIYDGLFASGAARVPADVTAISGDTTAADNLELQYDTTGLSGDTFPSTQAQLANIANVGAAVHITPASYVLTTGTQDGGTTIANVAALDGVTHDHVDDGGAMDLYYEFIVGAGIPSSVTVTGFLNSKSDNLEVYGFDWVAEDWVQIGTMTGKNQSTNEVDSFEMFVNMVGTGDNEGIVRVRFTDGAFTLTTATLAIDQIFLSFSLGSASYEDGAVWLDTLDSNTNTVVGIDGTERNPVSTIGAVNTLLASTNLRNVHVAPGSSVTFAAAQDNQVFFGHDWTLALGGRSVSNTYIEGATVSGTCTGAVEPHFIECKLGEIVVPSSIFRRCRLSGATAGVTLGTSGGDYYFEQCFSGVAGNATPKLTLGAGAQTVNFRHYSGGIQLEGMIATQTMSLEGNGQLIEGTCTGGAVTIRGNFTTSGITNLTLTDDARFDVAQVLATSLTENYAASGAAPTLTQAVYMLLQRLTEFDKNGRTITVRKRDGTTAFQLTLDDALNPTSSVQA